MRAASRPRLAPRRLLALAPIVAALAACGGGADHPLEVEAHLTGSAQGWTRSDDLQARTAATIAIASARWGGPRDGRGISVDYVDRIVDCGGVRAVGCAHGDGDGAWYLQIVTLGATCVELTTLPHEVGHVVLDGDSQHRDPRWRDPAFWAGMAGALQAIAPEDTPCADLLGLPGLIFGVDGS